MFHVDLSPFGVDSERLKSDRLERLQQAMRLRGLGTLLLTDPLNIRYATNTVLWLNLRASGIQRFALVPVEGQPVVYERSFGSERAAGLKKRGPVQPFDSYMFAMRPAVATEHFADLVQAGLEQLGLAREPLGVDVLNFTAAEALRANRVEVVDGLPAVSDARAVKTVAEIQLMRWTTQAKAGGYDLVRQALKEPVVQEERL
ncbi:MAG: aminopeptidase P family N-terminal domain-containing protein, partial [Nitrospiraceae bacterium]